MAQKKITFAGVEIVQPDEMMGFSFETTYTSDSGRPASGVANVSPMYTVQAYSLKWTRLTLAEAAAILNAGNAVRGGSFAVYYPSAVAGGWTTDYFYIGQGSLSWQSAEENNELIDGLSFNIIGVNPI